MLSFASNAPEQEGSCSLEYFRARKSDQKRVQNQIQSTQVSRIEKEDFC